MKPKAMEYILNGVRYSTEKATLIASDAYFDGHNFERDGRNTFLYRTPNGRYFVQRLSLWPAERDLLYPVCEQEAIELYESKLTEHEVPYEEAFPDAEIIDA